VTDRHDVDRLRLQIERDLTDRASLRTILAAAEATVARHRRELQLLKARIKRNSTKAS
jgi:hypothetical protein